jgi:hypothetical protein
LPEESLWNPELQTHVGVEPEPLQLAVLPPTPHASMLPLYGQEPF